MMKKSIKKDHMTAKNAKHAVGILTTKKAKTVNFSYKGQNFHGSLKDIQEFKSIARKQAKENK